MREVFLLDVRLERVKRAELNLCPRNILRAQPEMLTFILPSLILGKAPLTSTNNLVSLASSAIWYSNTGPAGVKHTVPWCALGRVTSLMTSPIKCDFVFVSATGLAILGFFASDVVVDVADLETDMVAAFLNLEKHPSAMIVNGA